MKREMKVWGERWLIRQDSTHAVSFLKLRLHTRCSWHKHDQKYNLFVVLYGRVGIVVEEELTNERFEALLTAGQSFTTKPGQWHEFKVYEESGMLEEMYVSYDEGDITRDQLGGMI